MLHAHQHYYLQVKVMDRHLAHCLNPRACDRFVDLRQELAVRESRPEMRMSAPSSPTPDNDKTDSAVQASLSLPATPLSKNLDNAFTSQTGRRIDFSLRCMQCHMWLHDSLGSGLLQVWPTAQLMQPSLHLLEYQRSILLAIYCAKLGWVKAVDWTFDIQTYNCSVLFFDRGLHKLIWCLIQEFVLFLRL